MACVGDARRRRGEVTEQGDRRRRAASKRGGDTIRQAFEEVLTRRVFAERVGIHITTVRRWEALGVVTPRLEAVRGIPTKIFAPDDVALGRQIVAIMQQQPGELSLTDAASIARDRRAARTEGTRGTQGG
jgi:hypothetical protein